jgi:hypothetical protein
VSSHAPQSGLYALWDNRFPRRVDLEATPRLDETLGQVVRQHHHWVALRHLQTLACMVVGLSEPGNISRTAWAPDGYNRAVYAQSTVRRLSRWLEQKRGAVQALYEGV